MMQRDVHVTAEGLLASLQYKDGDFGKIALISGQPQRALACLEYLENPVKNFSFFGYTFWTGIYKGKKVTVGNGGFYAPDSAFVTELLCEGGIQIFIRLGSCGAMRKEINVGDVIVADRAIRGEGATRYYVDDNFLPTADKNLTDRLYQQCQGKVVAHKGAIWTTDGLFKETKEIVNPIIKQGAIAVDMVTSPFFTVTQLAKRKTAAVLAVSDNLITGELGFNDLRFFDAQTKMVEAAFSLVKSLTEEEITVKEDKVFVRWEKEVEHKFKQAIAKMPLFQRRVAEKLVKKKAEKLTQEKNKGAVSEEELVVAFFKEVPPVFKGMMKNMLKDVGIEYTKYVSE